MRLILFLLISFLSSPPARASCLQSLSSHPKALTELATLRILLDRSTPSDLVSLTLGQEYDRKEAELISALMKEFDISEGAFRSMLAKEIERVQNETETAVREQNQRALWQREALKESLIDGKLGVFHPIEKGSFVRTREDYKEILPKTIVIDHAFRMMASHTTQVIWKNVILLARQKYPGKYDDLDISPSYFTGETLPVESVTPRDVLRWIEALNKLSQDDTPELTRIMAGHERFDLYRLPTPDEWEHVGHLLGIPDLTDQDRKRFFSTMEEPYEETQIVGFKPPLELDNMGFDFYMGNVGTLTRWPDDNEDAMTARGGSYRDTFALESSFYDLEFLNMENSTSTIGFRLVRVPQGSGHP